MPPRMLTRAFLVLICLLSSACSSSYAPLGRCIELTRTFMDPAAPAGTRTFSM
jgi:hypothetical protein